MESDAELVARLTRGDRAALAALYDRHAPLVFALVRRIVGSAAEAEDLVHDVFLEAWRRAETYDPGRGGVRTWLLLRARSRALDHKKSAAVSRTEALPERPKAAVDGDHSLAPDCARLRRALLALPQEQQHVLLLGYFEGLSSTEIAARVGAPVGTVKSRVAAALSKLRAALGEEG
ncbi:MAG: sigma-70 family RNA polymerase sigma factor [Myxococcales bacterium]|nr:sigma-70 family RNA polymerase sigma factor [Myxococcales bacterium]